MILHLLHMRRNVNRNVFNDRENVSATTSSVNQWQYVINGNERILNILYDFNMCMNSGNTCLITTETIINID